VAPLERSILRLALWEIRGEVSPPEVAIDEAVRLAKRYSTDDAGAFVNGVLGGIVRGDPDGDGEAPGGPAGASGGDEGRQARQEGEDG
jgi:N utilization substance protein B